jgi:hypothetical protein
MQELRTRAAGIENKSSMQELRMCKSCSRILRTGAAKKIENKISRIVKKSLKKYKAPIVVYRASAYIS